MSLPTGPRAQLVDRVVPHLVDTLLTCAVTLVPVAVAVPLMVAGSTELLVLGALLLLAGVALGLAFVVWNRVLRVARTGQSIGRRVGGIRVVDARTGTHPSLGQALVHELVSQVAGLLSAIWMLFDDEDRTLSDLASGSAVVQVIDD